MADVLSFAEVLAKVRTTSVSGVRTAQCVAELLLNAQGFYRTCEDLRLEDFTAASIKQPGE